MQNKEKVLDDIARLAGGAAGILSTAGKQARDDIKTRIHDLAFKLDMVPREDFERLEALVVKLREEQDDILKRLESLEPKRTKKNT